MDFNVNAGQKALIAEAESFAREELISAPSSRAEGGRVHKDFQTCWEVSAKAGYTGMPLASSVGGRELSLVDCMLVFEAMARVGADPGFLFGLGVHQFAASVALQEVGTNEQKKTWLSRLATGASIGALAVSEREAGSDTYAMSAQATEDGSGFILNGEKVWISNAPVADLILVCVRTDDAPGAWGISCFLVPTDAKGVRIVEGPAKSGLVGAPWGSVQLEDVWVSKEGMLGGRGGGASVFRQSMRWERCGLFAIAVGAMQKALIDCLAYLRDRHQFGKPLIDNDVVSRTVALMKTRCDAARLMLYKAASSIDEGLPDDAGVSLAKAFVSECAVANAVAGQELYGAAGVLENSQASKFLKDMLPFRVLSGPTDVQYKIAARLLVRGTS